MFDFGKETTPRSKCFLTRTEAGAYVNEDAPPTKRKPFSTFSSHPFAHTLDVVLPSELYELIKEHLDNDACVLRYSRVIMSLSEIISGDFFNRYIKKGNISMLSEGRPGVDNVFSLHEGILQLELDRATYERCGLQGSPIRDGCRKHIKSRFLVEINLRLPSMLHGKKGFGRIERAFKNVLNHSLTWLFKDHRSFPPSGDESTAAPIDAHHPFDNTVHAQQETRSSVKVPVLPSMDILADPANATELYEWLDLVHLDSPRVHAADNIDPYLSRYETPDFVDADPAYASQDLTSIQWHGFITPQIVTSIWLLLHKYVGSQWVSMNVGCFNNKAYTVFEFGGQGTLTFDCTD